MFGYFRIYVACILVILSLMLHIYGLCLLVIVYLYSFDSTFNLLMVFMPYQTCRRYMGHKRTIRPNTKKLNVLFKTRNQTGWDTFSRKVKKVQRGLMGEPDDPRHGRDDFHEMPSSCICQRVPVNRSATIQTRNLLAQAR